MPNIIDQYSATIVTIFNSVIQTYEKNAKRIKEIEDELNDLFHEAEFSKPKDMYSGYLIYKSIRELRNERRQLKEQNELLKDTYDFMNTQGAQEFNKKMRKLQSDSVKIENAQKARTYHPRQRTDLTIQGQTHDNKSFEKMMKEFKETKISIKNGKLRK